MCKEIRLPSKIDLRAQVVQILSVAEAQKGGKLSPRSPQEQSEALTSQVQDPFQAQCPSGPSRLGYPRLSPSLQSGTAAQRPKDKEPPPKHIGVSPFHPPCRAPFSTSHCSFSLPRGLSSRKENCGNEEEEAGGFVPGAACLSPGVPETHQCPPHPAAQAAITPLGSVSWAWSSSLRAKKEK